MKKLFVLFAIIVALCGSNLAQKKKNAKTNAPKKNDSSSKTETKKNEAGGSMFFITIEHNGEKTDLAYTQFENHDGNAMLEDGKNRMTFFYGAGNSVKNDEDFEFVGMIPAAMKGSYPFGIPGTMFGFKADKFPNIPMFLCEKGGYEISAMPLKGGFVEGTFTAACTDEVRDDGSAEKYNMSGSFKLMRMW